MDKLLSDEEFFSAAPPSGTLLGDEEFFGSPPLAASTTQPIPTAKPSTSAPPAPDPDPMTIGAGLDLRPPPGPAGNTSGGDAPGALSRGFVSGLMQQNPELMGEALEGMGRITGWDALGSGANDLRSVAKLSPEAYQPRAKSLWDAGSVGDALTWAGETMGQGIASTVPSLMTGVAGGAIGQRLGGKTGAMVGALGGAAVPSAALNYGEVYKALKDEGVDPDRAAEAAVYASVPITALDTASLGPIVSRFGTAGVRHEIVRTVARRVAVEMGKGSGREGVTEAAQEAIKQATVSLETGQPFFTLENAKKIAEAGVGGALVGGSMGGVAAAVPQQHTATPQPTETAPPNVTAADVGSPIPTDLISEGRGIVAGDGAPATLGPVVPPVVPDGAVPAGILLGEEAPRPAETPPPGSPAEAQPPASRDWELPPIPAEVLEAAAGWKNDDRPSGPTDAQPAPVAPPVPDAAPTTADPAPLPEPVSAGRYDLTRAAADEAMQGRWLHRLPADEQQALAARFGLGVDEFARALDDVGYRADEGRGASTSVSAPVSPESLSAPLSEQSPHPEQPQPSVPPAAANSSPAPILNRGKPFETAASADLAVRANPALRGRGLAPITVDGGWGLAVPETVPATPMTDAAPPLSETAALPAPAGRPRLSARAQAKADTLSRFDEAAGSPVAAWKGAANVAREIRANERDADTPRTARQRGGGYGYAYRRGWDDAIAGQDLPSNVGSIDSTRYREGWQAARRWAGENPRPEGDGTVTVPLRTSTGQETRFTLNADADAIRGVRKRVEKLPLSRFQMRTRPTLDPSRTVTVVAAPPMFGGNRKAAHAWARQNLQGAVLSNRDTGWNDILVGRGAIDKAVSDHGKTERIRQDIELDLLPVLPALLDQAVLVESNPHREGSNLTYHRLYAVARQDDILYRVKITVKENEDGRRYWDAQATDIERVDDDGRSDGAVGSDAERGGPQDAGRPHAPVGPDPTASPRPQHPDANGQVESQRSAMNLGTVLRGVKSEDGADILSPDEENARSDADNVRQDGADGNLSVRKGGALHPADGVPRRYGIPPAADPPISTFADTQALRAHPDYQAGKGGDGAAAVRLVADLAGAETLAAARQRFGPGTVFVPVSAEETGGRNAIPSALAALYAVVTDGETDATIVQSVRAHHTGAGPMERLISRPRFDGDVVPGGRYVLVDDVTTMGGTLAELANHIQMNGGRVVGVITLVNASRSGHFAAKRHRTGEIERRYGDAVRELFGIDPAGLTADEAHYILNHRDADALRTGAAKGARAFGARVREKGVRPPETDLIGAPAENLNNDGARPQPSRATPDSLRLSPAFERSLDGIEADLRARLERVGIEDRVALRLVDAIRTRRDRVLGDGQVIPAGTEIPGAAGRYVDRVIEVALASPDRLQTLGHEVIHALRDLGVLRPLEWRVLTRAVEDDGLLLARLRRDYAGLNLSDEALTEEAVAEMFGDWLAGQPAPHSFARRAFERIRDFFQALGNALRGYGFTTPEMVFRAIERGDVGRRGRVEEADTSAEPAEVFQRVTTPDWVFEWLGIDRKAIQANYDGLFRKYERKVREGHDKKHRFVGRDEMEHLIEHVMEAPDLAVPASKGGAHLLVRLEDADRAVVLEIKPHPQQHQIISAMVLTPGQLEAKLAEDARQRGGTPAFLVSPLGATKPRAQLLVSRFLAPASHGAGLPGTIDMSGEEGAVKGDARGTVGRLSAFPGVASEEAVDPLGMVGDRPASENIDPEGPDAKRGNQGMDAVGEHPAAPADGRLNARGLDALADEESAPGRGDVKPDDDGKFSLRPDPTDPRQPGSADARKGLMLRLLESQPIEWAFRAPFDIFGGMDQFNNWSPGKHLTSSAARVITSGKPDNAGAFGWMNPMLHTALKAYQMEDEVFRMALYLRRREQGVTAEQAAVEAREHFMDYDIEAPWVNLARRSFLPFIAYTYRAVPMLAKAIAHRPWKVAKYAIMTQAFDALSYAFLGLDDDDEDRERRSLRKEEQGHIWFGTPRMLRLPVNDKFGNPLFLDFRRWVLGGDTFDLNQGQSAIPIFPFLQPGGPLAIAAELYLNRQAFTGQDIANPLTDTGMDRAESVGSYLWKAWMPSAAWIPGSWYWDRIGDAINGVREPYTDRPYSVPQAVASSVGIKVKPQDVQAGFTRWALAFRKEEDALRLEARKLARDRDRGALTQRAFESAMAGVMEKRAKAAKRMGEVFGR